MQCSYVVLSRVEQEAGSKIYKVEEKKIDKTLILALVILQHSLFILHYFSYFLPHCVCCKVVCAYLGFYIVVSLTPKNFWHLFLYNRISTLYILDPASCSTRDNTTYEHGVVFYLPKLIRSNKTNMVGPAVS